MPSVQDLKVGVRKMSKYLELNQPIIDRGIENLSYLILSVLLTLFLYPQHGSANPWSGPKSLIPNTALTCSEQASNFFFIAPYAARTDLSQEGGTVQDVANDGFAALGLSYQTGDNYELELAEWLNTDQCLIHRLWPTRTENNSLSSDYFGSVGTLVRAAEKKKCFQLAAFPGEQDSTTECEEIVDASDQQMDIWISQIETAVLEAINDPILNNRIVAWYLGPEELRHWEPREKELLQRIYATVKKLDPLQRPAWMYNPQHSDAERLVQIGPWMDALSMGIYPHLSNNSYQKNNDQRIRVRHALTQMTTANALLGYSVLGFTKRVLPVLEMFENNEFPFNEADAERIPEIVRHDAYAAFANGADGLLIFSMGSRQGFTNYSTYYDAWADVAQQLTTLGLREVFQYGQVQNGAMATVTSGESAINFIWEEASIDETYPSLSVRDWLFEGKRYILVVNSSEGEVSFQLDNIAPKVYHDIFTQEQHNGTSGVLRLSLPPLGIMMLKSQSRPWRGPDYFKVR
jgi:hypothetical protein